MYRNSEFPETRNVGAIQSKWNVPHVAILGIIVTEFFTSAFCFSYGIIFFELHLAGFYNTTNGLWVPLSYIASYQIIDPWSTSLCEYFDNNRITISLAAFILFLTVVASVLFFNFLTHILAFGIAAGMASNVIAKHIKIITEDLFDTQPRTPAAVIFISRSLSLFVCPHLILSMIDSYKLAWALVLFSTCALNIIPASLLLTVKRNINRRTGLLLGPMIPLDEIAAESNVDLPTNAGKNFEGCIYDSVSSEEKLKQLQAIRHGTTAGTVVKILPEIHQNDTINIQRINEISTQLRNLDVNPSTSRTNIEEELISDQSNAIVIDKEIEAEIITEKEVALKNKVPQKLIVAENYNKLNEMETCYRYHQVDKNENIDSIDFLSPPMRQQHRFSYLSGKGIRLKQSIDENLLRPLRLCLTDYRFYVVLTSKTCITYTNLTYINTIPYLAYNALDDDRLDIDTGKTHSDLAFLLSLVSFAWCFFLVCLPVVSILKASKIMVVFILGLMVNAAPFLLLASVFSSGSVAVSSLIFGCGFGITSYCEDIVNKEYIGATRWSPVKGTLDTISAILFVMLHVTLSKLQISIFISFFAAFVSFTALAVLWSFVYLSSCTFRPLSMNGWH